MSSRTQGTQSIASLFRDPEVEKLMQTPGKQGFYKNDIEKTNRTSNKKNDATVKATSYDISCSSRQQYGQQQQQQ